MIAVIRLGLLFSEHWSECHAAFKQTSDNNAIVHLSSDPLGNPRSVDRRNSSGQSYVVMTDDTLHGWGALYQGSSVRGEWSTALKECHINYLELQVVLLARKHFAQRLQGKHVLVRTDNTTVTTYINRQRGTRSLPLLQLTQTLLIWASEHLVSLRAVHVRMVGQTCCPEGNHRSESGACTLE